MKRLLILALVISALFISCDPNADDDAGINGTWVLYSVDETPVSYLDGQFNLTLTVSNENTYTSAGILSGAEFSDSGTVNKKSDSVYTFTDGDGESTDYALDGDDLSTSSEFFGELVFKRD